MISLAQEFTIVPMRRLFKKHSDLRISDGAAEMLRIAIGEYGSKVAKAAVSIAQDEGRRTVLERDVIEAMQKTEEE